MMETRTAVARFFVLLAIITIPAGMMHRYSELFRVEEKLKADRDRQKNRSAT
ncbi:hypothetical protein [Rhizobium sp. CAU 1783]